MRKPPERIAPNNVVRGAAAVSAADASRTTSYPLQEAITLGIPIIEYALLEVLAIIKSGSLGPN
jgi:hypothetical protein